MTSETTKPAKSGPEPASAGQSEKSDAATEVKPPESAEDFDHVLRRLVAARDKLPHSG